MVYSLYKLSVLGFGHFLRYKRLSSVALRRFSPSTSWLPTKWFLVSIYLSWGPPLAEDMILCPAAWILVSRIPRIDLLFEDIAPGDKLEVDLR